MSLVHLRNAHGRAVGGGDVVLGEQPKSDPVDGKYGK